MCNLTNLLKFSVSYGNLLLSVGISFRKDVIVIHILSLDVGTTSMRGILYDESGRILASKALLTPLICDNVLHTMEQTPEVYTKGTVAICKALAAEYEIDAISVTAFRSAPTLVDRYGQALCNFIMWQDTRNSEICRRL